MEVRLRVELDDDADADELETAILSLRAGLADVPVEVERPPDPNPPPARSKAGINAGDVLLLTGKAIAFELMVDYLVDWVRARRRGTKLRIEGPKGEVLELPEATAAEVRRLFVTFTETPPAGR